VRMCSSILCLVGAPPQDQRPSFPHPLPPSRRAFLIGTASPFHLSRASSALPLNPPNFAEGCHTLFCLWGAYLPQGPSKRTVRSLTDPASRETRHDHVHPGSLNLTDLVLVLLSSSGSSRTTSLTLLGLPHPEVNHGELVALTCHLGDLPPVWGS
jgi:hypothetical protein